MIPAHANLLKIQTSEGVIFSIPIAGPVTRSFAIFIDILAIAVAIRLIGALAGLLSLMSRDLAVAYQYLIYFGVTMGYGIALEWFWRGQTVGKRLLRIRVMDQQGLRLQFSQVVLRNLLRAVDVLPIFYMLGGLTALLNRRGQRIGDLAANTVVIRVSRVVQPDLSRITEEKYNSFRDYPHLEARLRQRVSPQEAAIALAALARRDELDSAARLELFSLISDRLRVAAEFPSEATDGLSDEQYIRNAVESLYRVRVQPSTGDSKPALPIATFNGEPGNSQAEPDMR